MPRRRAVNPLKDLFEKNEFWMLKISTAPAVRRFVTLRAGENNVMRKLEVHGLLVRRFVTLRALFDLKKTVWSVIS